MAKRLKKISDQMAAVVADASQGVVRVEGRRRLPATGIIWSSSGLIITANHVLKRDEGIKVGLPDGKTVPAQLVGRDHSTDTALISIDAQELALLSRSIDDSEAVGNLVFALGRPGKSIQATLGIVSALGDSWRTRRGGQIDRYMQTDVLMYPGFSGGPLVGANGKLLGMNSSALVPGISVTIPASTLERVAQTLLTHGRIRRGYLGISTQRVQLPRNIQKELKQKMGLLVVSVEPDSPAEQGGIVLGDTIVGLEGKSIRSHDELLAQLVGDVVDKKVPVAMIRGGELLTINVKIGDRP